MSTLEQSLALDPNAAFPRLVSAAQHRIYALSLSLTGNSHDAEEVAQEAFVRAYRALQRYDKRRIAALKVRPWLAKIALNVWRNRVRGRRLEKAALDGELAADPKESPEARLVLAQDVRELHRLMAALPQRYRVAVVLRHAYGMPYDEAAAALGVPVGTLKAQVHRGTQMLRKAYEQAPKDEK